MERKSPVWLVLASVGALAVALNNPLAQRGAAEQTVQAAPSPPTSPAARASSPSDYVAPLKGLSVRTLLVLIPDPVESHFARFSDEALESVQRAAEASEYGLDRYWLPWKHVEKERINQLDKEHHGEPGVLVLRKSSTEWLAVFLVGELPTSGINTAAFEKALVYIASLSSGEKSAAVSDRRRIAVAGPCFSGSADSLRKVMTSAVNRDPALVFDIVTGSATNRAGTDRLAFSRADGKPAASIRRVVENDDYAHSAFSNFLSDARGLRPSDIAVLAEADTSYGRAFAEAKVRDPYDRPIVLPFPMQIARLRNAYQDDPELGAATTARRPVLPRQQLPLRLKGGAQAIDTLPTFSPELTAHSQDLVMHNLVGVVAAERVRYAGIVASDVLDTLFLGNLLRKRNSDVRLFVYSSDLLYQYSGENMNLRGMLMVTTYPLFLANQEWTETRHATGSEAQKSGGSGDRRMQFSSAFAQGVFNASRLLLSPDGQDPGLIEYTRPVINEENGEGASDRKPPLWLTVVGARRNWPVALLNTWGSADRSTLAPVSLPPVIHAVHFERPSTSWMLLYFLLTSAAFVHSLLVFRNEWPPLKRRLFPVYWIYRTTGDAAAKTTYLLAATGCLAATYLPVAALQLLYVRFMGHKDTWVPAMAVISAAAVVALHLSAVSIYVEGRRGRSRRFTGYDILAAIPLAMLAASCIVAAMCAYTLSTGDQHNNSFEEVFFVYRSLHPESGVSPLVPLLLVLCGFFFWAVTHLYRLRLFDTRRPLLPAPPRNDPFLRAQGQLQRDLNTALGGLRMPRSEIAFVGGTIAVTCIVLWPTALRSLEPRWFDLLYVTVLVLLYGDVLFNVSRTVRVWRLLRALLARLEAHPMHAAFSRLAGMQRHRHASIAGSLERLRALVRANQNAEPGNEARAASDFEAAVPTIYDRESEAIGLTSYRQSQKQLRRLANALREQVLDRLWTRGTQPTPDPAKRSDRDRFIDAAEEVFALRYVAFIRYAVAQIRNLMLFLTVAFIIVVASINSYPFQPYKSLVTGVTLLFTAIGGVIIWVLYEMDTDAVLSRLTRTDPGKVDRFFFMRAFSYLALPLLTVVSSQFPDIGRVLFSWVYPLLENLN